MRATPMLVASLALNASVCFSAGPAEEAMLPARFRKLVPLVKPLEAPQPGEWREAHPEPAETYRQYLRRGPNRAVEGRRTIYVQPLGEFNATQRKVVELTAQYLEIFFGLPVSMREDLPLSLVPVAARRKHPEWGMDQVLSTYVLERVLAPRLPRNACVYIAFTTSDLWPGEGWNFVFGQASLSQRVGVWSIYRFGDPEKSRADFDRCLRRTMKLATHETGHMFSLAHCQFFECNMCGSNHLEEADRRPSWLCPVCLAKLCYATGADASVRFRRLRDFARVRGFREEEEFYDHSLALIGRP
jgi:archaemetzincin